MPNLFLSSGLSCDQTVNAISQAWVTFSLMSYWCLNSESLFLLSFLHYLLPFHSQGLFDPPAARTHLPQTHASTSPLAFFATRSFLQTTPLKKRTSLSKTSCTGWSLLFSIKRYVVGPSFEAPFVAKWGRHVRRRNRQEGGGVYWSQTRTEK